MSLSFFINANIQSFCNLPLDSDKNVSINLARGHPILPSKESHPKSPYKKNHPKSPSKNSHPESHSKKIKFATIQQEVI